MQIPQKEKIAPRGEGLVRKRPAAGSPSAMRRAGSFDRVRSSSRRGSSDGGVASRPPFPLDQRAAV